MFEKADKRDKGFVSKSKFFVCLAELDIEMEEDMADALCAKFDFRGVSVQYTDFINFCVEKLWIRRTQSVLRLTTLQVTLN